jgi:hypothetical protein
MTPLSGVGGRLALALLLVVAGVLTIVYLIVVPSYRRSLENQELRSLSRALENVVLPKFPAEYPRRTLYVSSMASQVDARVVILDVLSDQGPLLEPNAD